MIFITTVFLWCAYFFHTSAKVLDSEDAKKRPWAYDHTSAMGMGIGFFINLILAVIVGIVLEVMINLPLDIAFIGCISFIGLWFLFKYLTNWGSKNQNIPSDVSRIAQNAFQGREIDIDDYLASDKYIERNNSYFWKVKSLDSETPIYQDSEGNFWSVSKDTITLSNDNGEPIEFTAHWFDDGGGEYVIAFHYSLTFGNTLEDYLSILNVKRCDNCEVDIQDIDTSNIATYELFSIQDGLDNSFDEFPFNEREIHIFKHGRQLLDRRSLTDKCLFRKYALEFVDVGQSIKDNQGYFNDEPLDVDSGPYLWWPTEKLPVKKGYKAFEDNDGNIFYVGRKKNIGLCHIQNGVPIEDNHNEIRVSCDSGYFMYEIV